MALLVSRNAHAQCRVSRVPSNYCIRRISGGKTFDSKAYLYARYHERSPSFPSYVARTRQFVEYYKKYCGGTPGSASAKALELGSGPSLNLTFCLAPHVSSIVLSDFEETNRKEVELWRTSSPNAFDWDPFFLAILAENEGVPTEDKRQVLLRTKEMKRKISQIVSCDLKADKIIHPNYVPAGGFDVITSNQVLSVAASTMEEFYSMFKNIFSIMSQGGLFICCITGRATWYSLHPDSPDPITYPILYVTEDDIRGALREACLELKEFSVHPTSSRSSDIKEFQFFVCLK